MATGSTLQIDITPDLILYGGPELILDTEVMVQDAGAVDVVDNTVLAYNPTTKKWTPFVSLAGTDGTAWPAGIYRGETILAATLAAGDVSGIQVIVGADTGLHIDEAKLVFEAGTLSLDSVCGPNVPAAGDRLVTCRQALNDLNIYPQPTVNYNQYEPIA